MPVPWAFGRPQFGNSSSDRSIEERAMKLRHLRGLQQYIMRLCKTGLLKYPDNMYIPETDRGKPIKWARISQHQINSEVVKKIIPKLGSCSWSEMVSRKESQTTDFFCSHGWSEPFREFMATIDEFVRLRKVTEDQGFWICVYANGKHCRHIDMC